MCHRNTQQDNSERVSIVGGGYKLLGMTKNELYGSVGSRIPKADMYPSCPSPSSSISSVLNTDDDEPQKQAEEHEGQGVCDGSFSGQHEHEHASLPSGMPKMFAVASRCVVAILLSMFESTHKITISSRVDGKFSVPDIAWQQ